MVLSNRIARPHSRSMPISNGVRAAAWKRLVSARLPTGPPLKKMMPPMFFSRTSVSISFSCFASLSLYAATIISCAMRSSSERVLKTESAQGVVRSKNGGTLIVRPLGDWALPKESAVTKSTSAIAAFLSILSKPRSYSCAKGPCERTIPNCEQPYWRTQEFQLAYGFDRNGRFAE